MYSNISKQWTVTSSPSLHIFGCQQSLAQPHSWLDSCQAAYEVWRSDQRLSWCWGAL